jgi:hypothetical protein
MFQTENLFQYLVSPDYSHARFVANLQVTGDAIGEESAGVLAPSRSVRPTPALLPQLAFAPAA